MSSKHHHRCSISGEIPVSETNSPSSESILGNNENSEKENPFGLSVLQSVFGAAAFISAGLFYVSWLYHRKYFGAMGIRAELISYPAPDYILNAKSVLALGTMAILFLALVPLHLDLESRKLRHFISFLSVGGIGITIVYLGYDILRLWSKLGLGVVSYRSAWLASLAVLASLLYSACAPTFLFKAVLKSQRFRNLSWFVVWSSLVAIAILVVSLAAFFIGDFEGKYDTSVSSRLPIINLAAKSPLGFGIQPDMIVQNEGDSEIYIYYHIRLVTQSKDVLYVLRPEPGIIPVPVHTIRTENVYALSFDRSDGAKMLLTTPAPLSTPTLPASTQIPVTP